MRKIYFLITVVFCFQQSFAQSDSLSVKNLDELVVTGLYKPQTLKNAVFQVRVISADQIQKQAATQVQDVLNKQLNIRFSQDVSTGGSDLSMMGLSGQNVKILIDGVPVIGRQGTSNEININQIDINSIERIEIVEGPMSVIYGADALAGVINIITKKTTNHKMFLRARVQEETIGNEYGWDKGIHNQSVSAGYTWKNWYISGGAGRNLFQGWKDTAIGRELLWHKKDQIVGNVVLGYKKPSYHVYYRFDGLDEIISNPANPIGMQPALDQDYMSTRAMHQLQGIYKFNPKFTANALASYTHFSRQVYSTLYYPNGDVRVATAPGTHSLNEFDGMTFRANVVYAPSEKISIQPGVDINLEEGSGERIKAGDRRANDLAFFITSEIKPIKKLNIRPGFRFIKNSLYDAPPVIPALNTQYVLSKNFDLRLSYARGFRSPSLRELFYDFFDASHSIEGNPDLQAEHSDSYNASLTWTKLLPTSTKLNASINGFYNDVDNLIDYATRADNPNVTTYMNVKKYKTVGGTIQTSMQNKAWTIGLGYGYTGRYNEYESVNKTLPEFKFSSEANVNINYSFISLGLDLNFFYKLTGKLPFYQSVMVDNVEQIELSEVESYHIADFTANKTFKNGLGLQAGIRNLFDVTHLNQTLKTGAHSNSGIRPIGYGRSYFLGIQYNWNK